MIEVLESVIPYISGLYTLPWILVGFVLTILFSRFTNRQKIDKIMKKIGLVLLYFFVPLLIFRIFLDRDFGVKEIEFAVVSCIIIFFTYLLAYLYARYSVKKLKLKGSKGKQFIKTMLTNQGRSSAFIGGALLASPWFVEAAIFIALVGIALFAVIPYILSYMHKRESIATKEDIHALPWYLRLYPWYLISFVIAAVILHGTTGITVKDFGDIGILFKFYTALTIPAALYYVGAGIHPNDLKVKEMKKLFSLNYDGKTKDHWPMIRRIFFLTVIITPLIISVFFGILLFLKSIPSSWFAVVVINFFLPITSTNMFLVPYGIDKKVTALSVTWTTIICVPIVVFLIYFFTLIFV